MEHICSQEADSYSSGQESSPVIKLEFSFQCSQKQITGPYSEAF